MFRVLSFLFFLLSIHISMAQNIQVLSQKDKQPVPFVNILYFTEDAILGGMYADELGKAFITIPDKAIFIEFSCLGYQSLRIRRESLPTEILLEEAMTELNNVIVKPDKIKTKKIGYTPKNTHIFGSNGGILEEVVLIKNEDGQERLVKSLFFYVKNWENLCPVVKVLFYANENGKPSPKSLIQGKENYFVLDTKNKGRVALDVQKLAVILPKEGLFVGLEFLGHIEKSTKTFSSYIGGSSNKKPSGFGIALLVAKKQNAPPIFVKPKFHEKIKDWIKNVDDFGLQPDECYLPAFGIEVFE